MVCISDVKISNITATRGCDGVYLEWLSPPTHLYQVRVNCNGFWCFIANVSNNSVFLSLEDFTGRENCTAFVSAVTAAGLGPEEDKPFAFYSSKYEYDPVLEPRTRMCMHGYAMCVHVYSYSLLICILHVCISVRSRRFNYTTRLLDPTTGQWRWHCL